VSGAAVIAGYALRELTRRRVLVVVVLLTALFLALYYLATSFAFDSVENNGGGPPGVDQQVLAGATLLGLSMFATLFLGAVLAVFLTFTVVRGDAERGLLQPLVVRPVGRPALLLGRFAAAAAICVVYVLVVYAGAVLITDATGGWRPDRVVMPGLALALAVVIIAALALLGSVFLTTIPNGIAVLMLFGGGLSAGLLGQVGDALPSERLQRIGEVASWALPFEALYQAGLNDLTAATSGLTGVIVRLGPLGGAQSAGPSLVLWSGAYLLLVLGAAVLAFARRDL
jgi:ABC-type transport system involved in multi-copper enzyme maturation permease subunit